MGLDFGLWTWRTAGAQGSNYINSGSQEANQKLELGHNFNFDYQIERKGFERIIKRKEEWGI
jgi:hypothetical protein